MSRAGIRGSPGDRAGSGPGRSWSRKTSSTGISPGPDRDRLWVTDSTEHPPREGKIYCAVVLDAYSRRVVGWSIDASPTAALVTSALGMAIDSRTPPSGAVIHSDRGVQTGSCVHRPGQGLGAGAVDGQHRRLL